MEKRCDYGIGKGLNHTGSEYFTKKPEKKVNKPKRRNLKKNQISKEGEKTLTSTIEW